MNIDSGTMAVFAASLLIICLANESLAGRRDGSIGTFADVHDSADMDDNSSVGSFSTVKAKAHLHRNCQVKSHAQIGKGAVLHKRSVVWDHAEVGSDAEIGIGATCENFSNVGDSATVGDKATIKQHSEVRSNAKIGPNCVVGAHSTIGRRTQMEKDACVAQHAHIGSGATLKERSVVQSFVDVPTGLKTSRKQIVISAPETEILLRMLRNRKYSKRFYKAVNDLVAKSDDRFARHFSREVGYVLSDLNDCKKITDATPQMIYLTYSYMQKMHGEKTMEKFMKSSNVNNNGNFNHVNININGKNIKNLNNIDTKDCNEAKRFDRIFDTKTVDKFVVMMAIYYDSSRSTRIDGDSFCSITKDLLANKRSVLSINEKCGGTKRSICDDCGDGSKTSGSYSITAADVSMDSNIEKMLNIFDNFKL